MHEAGKTTGKLLPQCMMLCDRLMQNSMHETTRHRDTRYPTQEKLPACQKLTDIDKYKSRAKEPRARIAARSSEGSSHDMTDTGKFMRAEKEVAEVIEI